MEDSRPFWRRKPLLFAGYCSLAACMAVIVMLQLATLAYPGGYDIDSNSLLDLNQATTLNGVGNALSTGLFKAAFIILAVAAPCVLSCMHRAVVDAPNSEIARCLGWWTMLLFHVPSCIAIACNWSLWGSTSGGFITYPLKIAEVLYYVPLLVGFIIVLVINGVVMNHSNALPQGLAAVNVLFLVVHLYGSLMNSGEIVIFGMVAWYTYASLLVIVAAIKKDIVKKGPDILWRSPVEHHDDARPKVLVRPKECPLCHSLLGGKSKRRCSACGYAWCLNCGTWNYPGIERCKTCQFMLPSD
ncbi:MAG: hypothetical protein GYA24_16520 [Candidatus Lokiarchaeota archaeon]|nr:hypothetical protein [Candidatus Lokiarchaeota archaeon]